MSSNVMQIVILSLFVVLGAIASVLLNLNEAIVKDDFTFAKFVKDNWLSTLTNVVIGICIVIAAYDDSSVLHMTKLMAFSLGAIAQQFFRKICNIFLTSKTTFIGVNRKHANEEGTQSDSDSDTL
jgi:hypothetical protein